MLVLVLVLVLALVFVTRSTGAGILSPLEENKQTLGLTAYSTCLLYLGSISHMSVWYQREPSCPGSPTTYIRDTGHFALRITTTHAYIPPPASLDEDIHICTVIIHSSLVTSSATYQLHDAYTPPSNTIALDSSPPRRCRSDSSTFHNLPEPPSGQPTHPSREEARLRQEPAWVTHSVSHHHPRSPPPSSTPIVNPPYVGRTPTPLTAHHSIYHARAMSLHASLSGALRKVCATCGRQITWRKKWEVSQLSLALLIS